MARVTSTIELTRTDITQLAVDAIVNAANTSLLGGGGVDGAIHRAAGPRLVEECKTLGGCPPGEAKITLGHGLKAKWVIHAVGPIWQGGGHGEAELLASCYHYALRLAAVQSARSVAFPAISCGAYGYPVLAASAIAVRTVRNFFRNEDRIERVLFCCFTDEVWNAYTAALAAADV